MKAKAQCRFSIYIGPLLYTTEPWTVFDDTLVRPGHSVCGIIPVIWLALMTAPYVGGGLVEIIRGLPVAMGNPFQITVCEDSVKTVLIFLLAYAMGIGIYFSTRRNYRRREDVYKRQWLA